MRHGRELIAITSANTKLGCQSVTAVSHNLAGSVVGNSRGLGREIFQFKSLQEAQKSSGTFLHCLGNLQKSLSNGLGVADRHITEGLDTTYVYRYVNYN